MTDSKIFYFICQLINSQFSGNTKNKSDVSASFEIVSFASETPFEESLTFPISVPFAPKLPVFTIISLLLSTGVYFIVILQFADGNSTDFIQTYPSSFTLIIVLSLETAIFLEYAKVAAGISSVGLKF